MASMIAAMPALSSAPRMVVPSVLMMSPSSMILSPAVGSTVSKWALRKIFGAYGLVPGSFAMTLPAFPPIFDPASSS